MSRVFYCDGNKRLHELQASEPAREYGGVQFYRGVRVADGVKVLVHRDDMVVKTESGNQKAESGKVSHG